MPKFLVRIYGKVPDEIEIEAKDREEAEEMALLDIAERLEFKASPIAEANTCAGERGRGAA